MSVLIRWREQSARGRRRLDSLEVSRERHEFDGHKRVRRGKTKGRVGQLGGDRMIDNLPNLDNPCAIQDRKSVV